MQLGFYFDQRRCTACNTCVVACKQWNDVPAGPAFWRWVATEEEGRFPDLWVSHLSLSCCHCYDPACVQACPASAISKRDQDGIVLVDREACISGCRACRDACPYDAPQFRDGSSKMEMCDFCLDRLEEGKRPMCVVSCPLRALDSGPMEELRATYGDAGLDPGFPDPSKTRPAIILRAKHRPCAADSP